MTQENEIKKLKTREDHVNFWFYDIGVPVIPFNTRDRKPVIPKEEHSKYFENLMTVKEFNKFKEGGLYGSGFLIKLGLIERGKYKGKYLNALDLDNHKAIQEFCAGRTLAELAQEMLVEQKPGDSSRCHVLWLSNNPVKSLGQQQFANEEGPEFSIKTKGPFFVSNSINRNGANYEFVEGCLLNPSVIENMEKHINTICEKYGIHYLAKLEKEEQKVKIVPDKFLKGERNARLFELATDILNRDLLSATDEEGLYVLLNHENNRRCDEPLDQREIRAICKSASDYRKGIKNVNDETLQKYEKYKENRNKREQEERTKDDIAHQIDILHLKMLDNEIYYYNSDTGNYVPGGKELLEDIFANGLRKAGKKRIVTLVNEKVKTTSFIIPHIKPDDFNPTVEWLGTKNCMLNVKTGEERPFSPDFMNTTTIPITYDPKQKFEGSKIQKFLNGIMSPNDVEIVLNFVAYCLWRKYKFANFLLFNGEGNNGKGTLIKLIQSFLGKGNYSGESLDRLTGSSRFATASLFGKLANFDADIKTTSFMRNGTDLIKKLTGDDEFNAEDKFGKPYTFTNYAKIIMSCNEIPNTTDRTPAFFKRIIIIDFLKIFYGDNDNVNLIDELTTENELSGLLNECLRRLPVVLEKGVRKFTEAVEKECLDRFDAVREPIKYFEREALVKTTDEEDRMTMREMYEYFREFSEKKGLTFISETMMIRRLHDINYKTKRFQIETGEYKFHWYGVQRNEDWKK